MKYEGHIYDPSYGSGPFTGEAEWENSSLDYYGINLLIEYKDASGMTVQRTINWINQMDDSSLQTTINP